MKSFKQSAFARFFTRFPQLLLASLIYTVPLAAVTGLFVLIGELTSFNNIIVWGLGLIPASPLYAGLVMVIRKYAVEKQDVNVFKTFMLSVKENYKKFLFHGLVFYLIVACSFFAILYYYTLAKDDIVFGSVMTLYILFTLLLAVMMFYVPLMTITYELRLRDIYKNAFLLIFGKILRNIIAMAAIAVVSLAAFTAILFAEGILFIVAVVLTVILYPLLFCYITNAIISKGLQDTVGPFTGDNVVYVSTPEEEEQERLALENADSSNDYVFVNGKMIKNNNPKATKK